MIIVRYARVPSSLMETPIPEGIKYSSIDGHQRTLREFVFTRPTFDMEDSTTIFRLACDESGRSQRFHRGTNEDDMIDWAFFMEQYGYGSDTWLTQEEVNELVGVKQWRK